MTKSFDYHKFSVVGVAEDWSGFGELIEVWGCCDKNDLIFEPLTAVQIINMFPATGKVYAGGLFQQYKNLRGKIVCIDVVPEFVSFGEDRSKYVWNKKKEVIAYGEKISTLKGNFTTYGQHNYDTLKQNNLLDADELVMCPHNKKIYQISQKISEPLVKYWRFSSLNPITYNGVMCFIGPSLPKHDGVIDIMTDEQLFDWYLSKIEKGNMLNITQNHLFRDAEYFFTEQLNSIDNLKESIVRSRLDRLITMNTTVSLVFKILKENNKTLGDEDSVLTRKTDKKTSTSEQLKKESEAELNRIREKFDLELLAREAEHKKEVEELRGKVENQLKQLSEQEHSIEEKLQEKNIELELLEETIKEKEQVVATIEESIAKINERKTSIVEDFSVIREVLNVTKRSEIQAVKDSAKRFSLEEINFSDNPVSRFQAYVKSLENVLKLNSGRNDISPIAMGKMLVKYNVLLCPSVSFAQTFILASHKCKYLTEYVSAKWASFDDLWENGLGYVVSQSMKEPNTMHFLILQNINISYLPNFMQPLVDIQKGIITKFPASDILFPRNLRILCTIAEDELIKMPSSVLRHFGCIDKSFHFETSGVMQFADDANMGYLTPDELNHEREQGVEVQNMFEKYIDE